MRTRRENIIIFATTYFLFGRFNNIHIFIGLFVMYGLYSALVDGSQKAMISDIVGKELPGSAMALIATVLMLVFMIRNKKKA